MPRSDRGFGHLGSVGPAPEGWSERGGDRDLYLACTYATSGAVLCMYVGCMHMCARSGPLCVRMHLV